MTEFKMAEDSTGTFDDVCDDELLSPYGTFEERLLSLDNVSVRECADMHRAIETLGLIESDIREFVNDVNMDEVFGMGRDDVDNLVNAYSAQLKRLKEKEGVNFDAAAESLGNCVRLAVLFQFFMHGWYRKICRVRLPLKTLHLLEHLP